MSTSMSPVANGVLQLPQQLVLSTSEDTVDTVSARPEAMELAIEPPSTITAGVKLQIPLVVTFSSRSPTLAAGQQDQPDPVAVPDLSSIWAFVSLTSPDMQHDLAPPRTDLLRGRRTDSVHPVAKEQEHSRPTIAYATFPELMITQPGQYRLKVNIIDMNSVLMGDAVMGAGRVLPSLHSRIFNVVDGDTHVVYEAKLAETVTRLRSIGIEC